MENIYQFIPHFMNAVEIFSLQKYTCFWLILCWLSL